MASVRNNLSSTVSGFISFATLVAMVMVVYIHGQTIKFDESVVQYAWLINAQGYFSKNLFHVSLPVFFSISAFLLFYGIESVRDIAARQRKRVKSLVVPYLMWSIIWVCALLMAKEFVRIDFGKHTEIVGLSSIVYHITLDPVANQFWYLRDLIVLVIVAPVFYRVGDWLLYAIVTTVFVMWFFYPSPTVISERYGFFSIVSNEALAWFSLGVIFARGNNVLLIERLLRQKNKLGVLLTLLLFILPPLFTVDVPEINSGLRALSISGGYAFLVCAYGFVANKLNDYQVKKYASYTFVVYAAHYPTIKILGKLAFMLVPANAGAHVAVYLLLPLIVIMGVIICVNQASKLSPNFVLLLNGCRDLAVVK